MTDQTTAFEYCDEDGDDLIVRPMRGIPAVLILTGTNGIAVDLDRVEEVVAGIRDAARQAAGQTTTEEERYTAEVVQAARRRYDAEPKCPNCGHLWEHHGDEVCGVRGRRQGIAYYCGCTDAEEDHTPAAERREQYGQVLRRWGLLDEVNDPKAAEEFAVTDLLAIVDAERAAVEQPAEAQPAEAHPAEHRWAAELHDPLADEWVPGTRYLDRDRAVAHLTHAREIGPTWKDGTPTRRRLVRETTTWTVEETP